MKINDILNEQQLNELGWSDIQQGAKKVTKGAQNFTKNVNKTGNAVAGAGHAVGGAIKAVGNQAIARPVGAAYNAVKGGLTGATNVAKKVGGDVAAGVGNVAKGVGAVAGGATTGIGRAAAKGFNAGADAVGGAQADKLGSVFKQDPATQQATTAPSTTSPSTTGAGAGQGATADVGSIENQITQHKNAISGLQSQLAQARAQGNNTTAPQDDEPGIGATVGNAIKKTGTGIVDAIKLGANAPAGMNVADKSAGMNSLSLKDKFGKTTQYKKLGDKWVGADNKEVDPSISSLLDKQAQSQATPTSPDYIGRRATTRGQATANPATTTTPATTTPVDDRFPKDINAPAAGTATPPAATTTPPATPAATTTPPATPAATPKYGQRPTGYATPTYNVPTKSTPSLTTPPFNNPDGTAKVKNSERKTTGAILPTQSPGNIGTATTTPVNKVNYKLPSSNTNMDQYYANKRAQNLKPPVNSGKINKKPALAEASIDFSALLLDKTK